VRGDAFRATSTSRSQVPRGGLRHDHARVHRSPLENRVRSRFKALDSTSLRVETRRDDVPAGLGQIRRDAPGLHTGIMPAMKKPIRKRPFSICRKCSLRSAGRGSPAHVLGTRHPAARATRRRTPARGHPDALRVPDRAARDNARRKIAERARRGGREGGRGEVPRKPERRET